MVENYLKEHIDMKKKYGLLFLLCLLMFFCINIDGVKADNLKCSADISKIEKAYACDYAGKNQNDFTEEYWSVSFTLIIVKYDGDKYCSMASQPIFKYAEDFFFASSQEAGKSHIRDLVSFDISYDKSFKKMDKEKKCPGTAAGVDFPLLSNSISNYAIADEHNYLYCGLGAYCVSDLKGANFRELDKNEIEKILKDTTLTAEQVIEAIKNWANKGYNYDQPIDDPTTTTCRAVLTDDLANIIKNLFTILSIIGIILVVVLGMTDFVSAITSGEDDALNKAFKKVKNRIIAVIILLLLPVIVNWIVDFANKHIIYDDSSKLKIGDLSDCFESSSSSSGGSTSRRATTK